MTRWDCKRCGAKGEVDIPEGTAVFDAVYMIEDDHKAVAPACNFDLGKVTVTLG